MRVTTCAPLLPMPLPSILTVGLQLPAPCAAIQPGAGRHRCSWVSRKCSEHQEATPSRGLGTSAGNFAGTLGLRGGTGQWEYQVPPAPDQGWQREAGAGGIRSLEAKQLQKQREQLSPEQEGRGRQVPRKAQTLGLSLGCIFIWSRGCTDGLSIEFHLQHHQRLILYSLLILP